jgi:putative SOS response-associated peptidase YedK
MLLQARSLLVIRHNHQTGQVSLDHLRWGLIPYRCKDPTGGRKPINAKAETVAQLPTFREAYRKRRCIVPVDGFFEWKAIKGRRAKQPYAIVKDGSPFGIGGLWENRKEPRSGNPLPQHCRIQIRNVRPAEANGRNDRPHPEQQSSAPRND